MEAALRHQKLRHNKEYPECPYVFFWSDDRTDKDGEQIRRFDGLWSVAVMTLAGPHGHKLPAGGRVELAPALGGMYHEYRLENEAA